MAKRIKNGSTQFLDNIVPNRTGILCPVAVVLTGALHPCTGYSFFLHAYVFLRTYKCIHKICLQAAYKQKQQPDLWPHIFACSFPSPRGLRNWSLMGLPQDLWTHEHTYCKRAESPPCVAPTKVSRSEKPDGRLFMQLVPRSARSCSWASCWPVPSAVQKDFCAYQKILKYCSFSRVTVYLNDHPAALLYYSLGPHSAKPLSTFFSWSIYFCIFLKHWGRMYFHWVSSHFSHPQEKQRQYCAI